MGLLTVKGENLRVNKLSIDTSETIVNGNIMQIAYSENTVDKKGEGIFSKIFK